MFRNKLTNLCLIVIFVLILGEINLTLAGALCPPQSLINPCSCNSTTSEISCKGLDIDLDNIFERLTHFLPDTHRDFDALYLNARSIHRLESNQFRGIRFRQILLGGSKLTYIHKDAFMGTHLHLKELFAFATNLSHHDVNSLNHQNEYNLFQAITLLKNLQRLVISGHNIRAIPERAFKPRDDTEDSVQRDLTDIELGLGVKATIVSIGTEAFADLPALRTLGLSQHRIERISRRAFSFNEPSNKTLAIDLTANHLNENSLDGQTFIGTNRPMKIYFGLNGCNKNLTFFNQTIFEPFLADNPLNQIDMGRGCGHMTCDCRMSWLVTGNYEQQIKNLKCSDGQTLIDSIDITNGLSLNNGSQSNKCRLTTSPSLVITNTNNILKPRVVSNKSRSLTDEDEDNELEMDYEYSDSRVDLCLTDECYEISTEMKKYLNKSLNPCDNFYDYACGRWEDSHLLEYLVQLLSNGGVEYDNFVKLRQQIDTNLDQILSQDINTDPQSNDDELPIVKKTIHMYQRCKQSNSLNIESLMAILQEIGGWPIISNSNTSTTTNTSTSTSLPNTITQPYKWQKALGYIFSYIRKDILINLDYVINENSVKQLKISHSSFILSQTILLDMNKKSYAKDIQSYAKYIHDVSVLYGAPPSHPANNQTLNAALDIIKFESEIAKISDKSQGKEFQMERQLKTLDCLIPEVNWTQILTIVFRNHNMSLGQFNEMNVILDIHYMIRLSVLLRKTNPVVVGNYLGWRVAETMGFLVGGQQFLEYQNIFHNSQSNERTKILWKQCLRPLKTHVPYLLTREYAKKHLPQPERHNVQEIVKSVKQSFIDLIAEKQWLDNKLEFINKVETIRENVGYPLWLFDDNQFLAFHQNLSLGADTTPPNVNQSQSRQQLSDYYINLWTYSMHRYLDSVGKWVNKSVDWDQSPLYVGASYDIIDNLITIPIGLLHPPFYDSKRPAYINFGSIGSFVGHEISHASMPRYNSDERLLYPWNDSNIHLFLSRAKCFVDQYSAYFDQSVDMNLDGMKTFEEDIGDIAGLKASFNAFNNLIKQNFNKIYNDIKLLPNFSQYKPQQLFFLSYAQKWCRYITPTQVRIKILRGVHSPEKYRVNGALSNFEHFAKAFDCPIGSNMNPEVKCEMW